MSIEEIVERLKTNRCLRKQGKSTVARRLHCSIADVEKARRILAENNNRSIYHSSENKELKVLLFDIETAPMRAYVWGRWNQNISLSETISEWFMLCWSAKWLGKDTVISEKLTPEEALKEDDKRITEILWDLINKADIVVAYNGKKADIKWMNTRFIIHGMNPPSPYLVVDPCATARSVFGFSSNKLDALAGYFGIEHKAETSFELWDRAVRGDKDSLDYMTYYCRKDVVILEKIYLKLRPWDKKHPNCATILKETICPICGSKNYINNDKKYFTASMAHYLYKCLDCGANFRIENNKSKICNH